MHPLAKLAIGGSVVLLGASVVWRYAVRRFPLPCPSWLAWTLETPFMELAAGSATILARAAVGPGMRVLDAGCGAGRLTLPAADRVGASGEVVALDVQPGMLEMVEKRVGASGATNVRPRQGRLGEGVVEPSHYDRILLVTVLGEAADRRAVLDELATALKPGGILSITEILLDPHYQRPGTVRRLALEAGLSPAGFFGSVLAYTANFTKGTVTA